MRPTGWALGVVFICLAATCLAASNPAETVPFDTFYSWTVEKLVEQGILEGYPRTHEARVEQTMTRYEFVVAWARFARWAGIQPAEDTVDSAPADVPGNHWARGSAEYLAACGLFPTEPFRDVDPFHWAAGAVHRLSPRGASEGGGRSALRGDQPLLRREYMDVVHRTARVLHEQHPERSVYSDLGVGDVEAFVVDEGLFIGHPRTRELHPYDPMMRWQFCIATARVMEHELFAP